MELFEDGMLRDKHLVSIGEAKYLKILINSGGGLFKNNKFMQSIHKILRAEGIIYLMVVDENSNYVDDISDAYNHFYQEESILSTVDYRFSSIRNRNDVIFDIRKTFEALESLKNYKDQIFVRTWMSTFRCSMFIWGKNDAELSKNISIKKIKLGYCWINIALPPFGSDILPAIHAKNTDNNIFHKAQIHYDYIWNRSSVRSIWD